MILDFLSLIGYALLAQKLISWIKTNPKTINRVKNHKFSVFQQKMYYYKFNLLNKTNPNWYGTRICKKKFLKSQPKPAME